MLLLGISDTASNMTPFLGCIKKRQHINVSGAAREPFLKRLSELPSTDEENSQVQKKLCPYGAK
jgi:hypothetical protein